MRMVKKARIPRINENSQNIPDRFSGTPGGFLSTKAQNRHQKSVGNVSRRYDAMSRQGADI